MPHIKKQQLDNCIYFITTVTNGRLPIFRDDSCCDILIDDIKYYRKMLDFLLLAYVIMPNHLHLLLMTGDKFSVSKILQKIKGHSGYRINESTNQGGSIWQADFFPKIIGEDESIDAAMDYIHNNPVKHGFVETPDAWKYSSYRSIYLHDHSIIKADILEW
jgi:putative transposase